MQLSPKIFHDRDPQTTVTNAYVSHNTTNLNKTAWDFIYFFKNIFFIYFLKILSKLFLFQYIATASISMIDMIVSFHEHKAHTNSYLGKIFFNSYFFLS